MKKIKLTQSILMAKGVEMLVTDTYAQHLQTLALAELVPDKAAKVIDISPKKKTKARRA